MEKTTYICDMCGKEFDYKAINKYKFDLYTRRNRDAFSIRMIDLCDECSKKWFDEVKMEPPVEEE